MSSFNVLSFFNETDSEKSINQALREEYFEKYTKARFNFCLSNIRDVYVFCFMAFFAFSILTVLISLFSVFSVLGTSFENKFFWFFLSLSVSVAVFFAYWIFSVNSFSFFGVSFFSKSPENIKKIYNLVKIFSHNKYSIANEETMRKLAINLNKITLIPAFMQILSLEMEFDKEMDMKKYAREKAYHKKLGDSLLSERNKELSNISDSEVRRKMLETALKNFK